MFNRTHTAFYIAVLAVTMIGFQNCQKFVRMGTTTGSSSISKTGAC